MPRSIRAVRAEAGPSGAIAMHCDCAFRDRPARFEDEGPAIPPLRHSVARCAEAHRWRNAARGDSCGGTFVPCHDVTGHVGAGIEPATLGFQDRCSTRLSYPMVDVPDSNRRPTKSSFAALTSELPSSRNTFSRPRAYATAAPRAPDGHRNPYRWKPFDRCFALTLRKRQSVCAAASARRPCPASGHSASSASQRNIPVLRLPAWMPRVRMRLREKMLKSAHGCAGPCEGTRVDSAPLRTRKRKRPRVGSEGVRVPRRSGRPISETGSQSNKGSASSRSRGATWPASR